MDPAALPAEVAQLQFESNGTNTPITEHPLIKETPDLPTFFKRAIDQHSEIGRRVRLPGKDAKPEDVEGLFNKLEVRPPEAWLRKQRGVPEKPDGYEYVKPEGLPEGVVWNDELVGKARDLAHKLGWSKQDFTEALNFHNGLISDMIAKAQAEQDKQYGAFKTEEETKTALKTKWGGDFDKNYADAEEGAKAFFADSTELYEMFKGTPLARTPLFVERMREYRLATMEDKEPAQAPGQDSNLDAMIADIEKPGGSKYERWIKGDSQINDERLALYAKKHPGRVEIT
jgi:hypothetical protein